MYCYKRITDDIYWVGANDRRLAMFEGVYSVPRGVSYNSYLLLDEETVLIDTVDKAVSDRFFENLSAVLGDRKLNYVIVQHMEPDHSATLRSLLEKHPETIVVINLKTLNMIKQFFEDLNVEERMILVKEGDKLPVGKHILTFISAPMVHWPEVMITYDITDKILFSADAFGSFGALNGAIFADEVDFERDYLDEARRYYTNIVGKYGVQVQSLLKKASAFDIEMICPLHGFVWRKHLSDFIEYYQLWSSYTPEKTGVMIAYASVYGNTENAAEILSSKLRDNGIETVIFDVSVTPASEIVSAAFKYSHLVFASTTYNAGIFVSMEALLADLTAHNIQNRTVALIENGSWAPTSESNMRKMLSGCTNINILENSITIRSSLKKNQLEEIDQLVKQIIATIQMPKASSSTYEAVPVMNIDNTAMFKLSYGLFVLTAKDGDKDNGCIINTVQMVTDTPKRISVTVNKANLTHDMIKKNGIFNVSVLSVDAPFKVFKHFGFSSGRNVNKFENEVAERAANGVAVVKENVNAIISGKVINEIDLGTHTLFIADVTEAICLSSVDSMTYDYYFKHVKPKPAPKDEDKTVYVCSICGYEYEGEELPDDFICPWCKHGKEAFEKK